MFSKLKYVAYSLSRGTNKKYETYVINRIYSKLNNNEIEIVTQQTVITEKNTYNIDLYFPQIKFAVEVDEFYHNNPVQHMRDEQRENNIKTALESMIIESEKDLIIERIKIYDEDKEITLEKLNKNIDEVVNKIKERIYNLKEPLKWETDEHITEQKIIDRGYLVRGDKLTTMVSINHVFGNEVKCCRHCGFKYKNDLVWSPTLSFKGTNCQGWVNTISKDLTTIYECGILPEKGKVKTEENIQSDLINKVKRITFIKYKDALGNWYRRFVGVYECVGYEEESKSEVWKLINDKYYF